MSEREQVVTALGRAGIIDAVAWAWSSAVRRTALDYDPDTGHDQVWLGLTAHKLFCDRLDRVFHCRKYAVEPGGAGVGLDVLGGGLASGELAAMPGLRPGAVLRADVTGSPGWRHDHWHWLITSFGFGGVRKVSWSAKTPAKQRHARAAAFEEDGLFSVSELDAQAVGSGLIPLVIAHSVNSDVTEDEFHLGRPRLDAGEPWHWLARLDGKPWEGGARIAPFEPATRPSSDAQVRTHHRSGTGE